LNDKYQSQNLAWHTVQSLSGIISHKRKHTVPRVKKVPQPDSNSWMAQVQGGKKGYCHQCSKSCNGKCGYWYSGYLPITGIIVVHIVVVIVVVVVVVIVVLENLPIFTRQQRVQFATTAGGKPLNGR
jgi:hypothetical protein